jgi:hypothetical protein
VHRAFLTFAAFAAVLFGCKARTPASDVKFGLYADSKQALVYQPDGATITACGMYLDDLRWAINVWGAAIGRSYNVVENCTAYDIAVFGSTNQYAKTSCDLWKLNGRNFAFHSRKPREIVNCPGAVMAREKMLHEVGHLFGLCDQYTEQVNHCEFTTTPVLGSVMNAASTTYLTDDDVEGIKALVRKVNGDVVQPRVLESGLFTSAPLGTAAWQINASNAGGRTTAVEIRVGQESYPTSCDQAGACAFSQAVLYILAPNRFNYVKNGQTTVFARQTSSPLLADAAPTRQERDTDPPLAREFYGDATHVFDCNNPRVCDAVEPKDQNMCLCRFYAACAGMEVISYCAP